MNARLRNYIHFIWSVPILIVILIACC